MKKITAALLALLLLLPFPAAAQAAEPEPAEAVVEISDLAGLLAMADAPEGSYRLAADIDLASEDWEPFPFRGTLDGAGHTLYNLHVTHPGAEVRVTRDGNLKTYDTVFAGLFSSLEKASVHDLNLVGAELKAEGRDHCFAGLLTGFMEDSRIENCSVQGRGRLDNYAVQSGIGGLAGFGCGEIVNCRADVELIFVDHNLDARCEQFMGGLLSCGIAYIEGCSVSIQGYDSCHGYVHNGGLVGMYYYCGYPWRALTVKECQVSGQISFFEDNPNRRAYCAPYVGEPLTMPANYWGNTSDFQRNETFDYTRDLLPELCEQPQYSQEVTPPDCTHWGHVHHECQTCGYAWTDSYFPPQHTPGEWSVLREAGEDMDGLREQRCTVCGEVIASEAIVWEPPEPAEDLPAQSDAEGDELIHAVESTETLGIWFRSSRRAMHAADAKEPLTWTSDDPSIASVDETGLIRGNARGSTTVRYTSADGLASGVCEVSVHYSLWQWFLILFCFGWLWYL